MCIKGLIWPPLEPQTKNCFSPISSDWFVRRITEEQNSSIFAMVTKMARQRRLKIKKLPFWTKFKAFGDLFF